MAIRIMGIDAAFKNVGFALTEMDLDNPKKPIVKLLDLHIVQTEGLKKRPKGVPKSADDMRRAREAIEAIRAKTAEWKPDFIVAEVPFGSQSARSAWTLGIALGILSSIDDLIQVTPRQVKAATGEAYADKEEMIAWAMEKFPDGPWKMRKLLGKYVQVASVNEHQADALAACYAAIPEVVGKMKAS
jgi:Holliday junction resolvasome RuvABC endonuclease subunit